MNPRVESVKVMPEHRLEILFKNGEKRIFDVTPYLDKGIFRELKDETYFGRVRVVFGSIEWPNEQDFCKDTLYLAGAALNT